MDGPITLEKTLRGSLINEVLAALLGYTGGDAGTVDGQNPAPPGMVKTL